MKILVVRPEPAVSELITALHTKGFTAFALPLIRIERSNELNVLNSKLKQLNEHDLIFLLSKNAVWYANLILQQEGLNWSDKFYYYGIGRSTSKYFQEITGKVARWSEHGETSETLLNLPELQFVKGKRALLLRGNGGRELLASTLRSRGAYVEYCECYTRHPVFHEKITFNQQWMHSNITDIVISSSQLLTLLNELIDDNIKEWWFNHRLLVVSKRIANQAYKNGWQRVYVSNSADNHSLLEALLSTEMK
ncbi:Uroporphyrinogen-III synthase [Candidatus Hartigia pinicola]|nr:Uroporphyrinogen-III synthase [Candidatus Hartigia pinicola]